VTGPGEDWLLFLGAGASAVCPTHLPTFDALSTSILVGLGWEPIPTKSEKWRIGHTKWRRRQRPDFPQITTNPEMPPEVVFGTLHRFGVPFAGSVEDIMLTRPPNAVHDVAAQILASGAPVWTPNVDIAIERRYRQWFDGARVAPALVRSLPRTGAAPHQGAPLDLHPGPRPGSEGLVLDLEAANPSTLVKFHGTCDVPGSLAFTDLELLAPPTPAQTDHLAGIAADRRLVFYGYAGADADLRELLRACAARARAVIWFEPNSSQRSIIQRRFSGVPIDFRPHLPDRRERAFRETARAFLDFARDCGLGVCDELVSRALREADGDACPRPGGLRIPRTPGIVHARLVERFGHPAEVPRAIRSARKEDLRTMRNLPKLRPRTVRAHGRWALSESLYSEGVVARTVRAYARREWLLQAPVLHRPRDFVLDKVTALMLTDGDWPGLLKVTSFASSVRHTPSGEPRPNDRYYRAHALRYAMRVTEAIDEVTAAEQGLRGSSGPWPDAERLAGAVLELGILADYQGRFADALDRADDLRTQRGRYAIQRWSGWGHWLAGTAHVYRGELADAEKDFDTAETIFSSDPASGALADVDIGRLMLHRARLAVGEIPEPPRQLVDITRCRKRVRDDDALVRADIALGQGDLDEASRLLDTVRSAPSSEVAALWCELGTAEILHRRASADSGPIFGRLCDRAQQVGARWLQIQALIGMAVTGQATWLEVEDVVSQAPLQLPAPAKAMMLSRDSNRVLWMVL
jgi:hypothetical protein